MRGSSLNTADYRRLPPTTADYRRLPPTAKRPVAHQVRKLLPVSDLGNTDQHTGQHTDQHTNQHTNQRQRLRGPRVPRREDDGIRARKASQDRRQLVGVGVTTADEKASAAAARASA